MKKLMKAAAAMLAIVGIAFGAFYISIWAYGNIQCIEPVDIICVFGAAVWGNAPSPELEARLLWASELYQKGLAPRIFLSGGPTGTTMTEADVMGTVMQRQEIPRSALILDNYGTTTAHTLRNLKRYMASTGLKTCLMVSSPFHMARIMTLARLEGLIACTCPPTTTPASGSCPKMSKAILREQLALLKDIVMHAFLSD